MEKICLIISVSVLAAVCVLSVVLVRVYVVAGSLDDKITEIINKGNFIHDSLHVIENSVATGFASASAERKHISSNTADLLEKSEKETVSYFMTLSGSVSEIRKSLRLSDSRVTEADKIRKLRLMEEGKKLFYDDKNFSGSLSVFKSVLGIDPEDVDAEIYTAASMYYINPGDGSVYRRIKRLLVPLVDSRDIGRREKSVVLEVLEGICREENDKDAEERYRSILAYMGQADR